jgi:glycosyltransferase involved in cell wall biosynthesis
MNSRLLFVFKIIEKIVYWRSNVIHFISDYSCEMSLISKTDKKIVYIHNTTPLAPSTNIFNKFKKTHNDYYLIVRSIEIRANFDLILSLAKEFKSKKIKEAILVGGKGPLLKKYLKEVEDNKLDNLRFLGYVSDDELRSLYYFSKGVIVPALYGEGFGLPIIEGYAYGKPVIASNVCAMPHIIYDRSYLFENNIDSLLLKIKLLGSSPINSSLFLKYYHDNFSKKIIQKQYRFLYGNLFKY